MRQIRKNPEPGYFVNWKKKFQLQNGRRAVYDDLKGTKEYFSLKKSLLEEQGYLCCYCERKIGQGKNLSDCDIEHFMPRHPDHRVLSAQECVVCENAQLDYMNLFASCKGENADGADHCNHKKDNWFNFRTCISPTDQKIAGILGFKLSGEIFIADPVGAEMVKHLNLSSYILEQQRKAAFDTMLDVEFEDEDLFDDKDYVEAVIEDYDNMQDGEYAEFCSMITYCLRKYYMPDEIRN